MPGTNDFRQLQKVLITDFNKENFVNSKRRTRSIDTALSACRLWAVDRQTFQVIMMKTGMAKHTDAVNLLKRVPLFTDQSEKELHRLADLLDEETFKSGDYIVRQGCAGTALFIIAQGQCRATVTTMATSILGIKPKPHEKAIRTLGIGDYFGEQSLLGDEPHASNVVACESVKCLALARESYQQLIGGYIDSDKYASDKNCDVSQLTTDLAQLALNDLEIVATLGIGGFGRVELTRSVREPTAVFALKVMKKQHIVETKQQTHILNERQIMMEAHCDHIVKLYKTYKDHKYLYMLLEPCLGGEVWSLLRDRGYFDDTEARFYIACAMEALEYLHCHGVVYRDLKPENILLDSRGYAKLVDFGFAKKIGTGRKTWTFCGTPEYVAPEVVLNKGHDSAVDMWSLGILIYELLCGVPPFASADPMRTYNMILKGIDALDFPRHMSKNAITMIKKLCRDSPAERLGCGRGGMRDVRKVRWFESFDFQALKDGTLQAPYQPQIKHSTDTSNFDNFAPDSDPPPDDDDSGWDIDF